MRRRTPLSTLATSAALPLAAACLLAGLAGLTGCGASAAQPNAALPAAGAASAQASNGPATATMPADAPKFAIPADLRILIDADATGNATKDAVLLGADYQFYGFVEAISSGNASDANFRQWTIGDAYASLSQSVNTWKSRGERLTGTDHVYDRAVTMSPNGSRAVYTACEDSTRAYPLKIGSGQRLANTSGAGNHTLWQGTFIKEKSDTWVLEIIFTKPGASQCVVG